MISIYVFSSAVNTLLLLSKIADVKGCCVCEEYSNCVMVHNVSQATKPPTSVKWKTNVYDISTCVLGVACLTYSYFQDYVKSEMVTIDNGMSFVMTLNVSRKRLEVDGSKWQLVGFYPDGTSAVIFEATLEIVVKPKQLTCGYNAFSEGLFIECLGSKSYPESGCLFSIKVNTSKMIDVTLPEYKHTQIKSDDNEYYLTKCSLRVPGNELTPGFYQIDVLIYPSSTPTSCDNCGSANITLVLEYPKIELENCSQQALEGTRLDCTCKQSDKSDLAVIVKWYKSKNKTALQYGENISILTEKTLDATNYECKSENALGWTSNQEYYSPHILYTKNLNVSICTVSQPYLCPVNGICYGYDEYCSDGKNESCFPAYIKENELQNWCKTKGQFDVSIMRDKSCTMACAAKFGNLLFENNKDITVNIEFYICLALMVFLLTGVIIYLIRKKTRKQCKKPYTHAEETEGHLLNENPSMEPIRQAEETETCIAEEPLLNPSIEPIRQAEKLFDSALHLPVQIHEIQTASPHKLHSTWVNCNNSQAHQHFILISEFRQNPEKYLESPNVDTLKLIEALSELTVRIVVQHYKRHSSSAKPEIHTDVLVNGSGLIIDVELVHKLSACSKVNLDQERKKTKSVYIATSTNLVHDDDQASTVVVYIENEKIRQMYGKRIIEHSIDGKSCIIECLCDEGNITHLQENLNNLKQFYLKLQTDLYKTRAVIISYPHGDKKYISFANFERSKDKDHVEPLIFISDIQCPGNEGAPVLLLHHLLQECLQGKLADMFLLKNAGVKKEISAQISKELTDIKKQFDGYRDDEKASTKMGVRIRENIPVETHEAAGRSSGSDQPGKVMFKASLMYDCIKAKEKFISALCSYYDVALDRELSGATSECSKSESSVSLIKSMTKNTNLCRCTTCRTFKYQRYCLLFAILSFKDGNGED